MSDGLRKVGGRTVIGEQKTAMGGTLYLFGGRLTAIGERLTVIVGGSDSDFSATDRAGWHAARVW